MKNPSTSLFSPTSFIGAALLVLVSLNAAEPKSILPDLTAIPQEQGWKLVNRSAVAIEKDGGKGVHLEGKASTGYARLENLSFANGVIEFDARGKNLVQQSFLGLAFHGAGEKTYDAIYFRPFNFNSSDAARRLRAVQYVSHPVFTWDKLRSEHPGQYEKPIVPPPDPDGWFHVRVVVAAPKVSVFVNDATAPCLVVDQLSDRKRGWVGLWVDVAGGDFANLKIIPAP
ncbi:MAG: hypothetical protein QM790_09780 [Nibricoccus sp.]